MDDLGQPRGSVFWGAVWMLLLSMLLFWLPGIGSLIAGVVGGKVAGSVGRAFLASLLPSIALGAALFVLATLLTAWPLLGFIAAIGGFTFGVVGAGVLIVGALIGGLLADG
jgi:hypothetical protein